LSFENKQEKIRISYKFSVICRFEESFENKLLERKSGFFRDEKIKPVQQSVVLKGPQMYFEFIYK